MANVIKLDKYRYQQKVELDGVVYTVRGFTVQDYVDGILNYSDLDKTEDQFLHMVNTIERISNIPKEKLINEQFAVLSALMAMAQGRNPDEAKDDEKGADTGKN